MELKKYQKIVLDDLDSYIENILDTRNSANAYDKLWSSKGYRIGGENGVPLYKDSMDGVPSICFKVPTGGGKTYLACSALKHIFDSMDKSKKKVVVWLVPWETILTQTYENLINPNHFYREKLNRDFSSKVAIYNKLQALSGANFSPLTISDQLSIVILSFDSLRANNKENRKVYEENSNLLPFVGTFENKEDLIKDVDESALMQVLNQCRPVVIIDESHNATSDLSKEMIKNLNPSFVLELTATPKEDSNIISIVTANQLKEENMVKLPVIAYNRPSINRVISESLDLREALEKAAIKERQEKGIPYIRPIVLFQAQPKNDDDSVTFEKLKNDLIAAGIPEEQIAIKTANINELHNIDLKSEDCPIRYIITINALKEGWDCPFAYILASLANRTSKVDVEQILGRILRQPHQKKYSTKILNLSYVLTSSQDFSETLDNILLGLNNAGFSKNDCRVIRTNTLDNLNEERTESQVQGSLYDESQTSSSNDIESDIFNIDEIKDHLDKMAKESSKQNADQKFTNNKDVEEMINQANIQNDQYDKEIEESVKNGTDNIPAEFRNCANLFSLKNEFKDYIINKKFPCFCFKRENLLLSQETDYEILEVDLEYLTDGFTLTDKPIPINITSTIEDVYKVDVETNVLGSVIKKSLLTRGENESFKNYLSLKPEEIRIKACKRRLIDDLNNKFDCIAYQEITNYVDRIVDSLTTEDKIASLQNNIFAIGDRIKKFINDLIEDYRYNSFKKQIASNDIFIVEKKQLKPLITISNHTDQLNKTLYEEEDSKINGLENNLITKISSLPNIRWWHRIIERNDYFINGFLNHYPDFIICTNSDVIIFVETKGEHLDGDDSKRKLELGKIWSNQSGPTKYKYFMAFDHSPLQEDGADIVDNIVDLIRHL